MDSPPPSAGSPSRAISEPAPRRGLPGRVPAAAGAVAWLAGFGALAAVLVRLYPDSYQQDGGFHYIFARWAFAHPRLFVDVWGRPLFTLLYAGPAQLGYPAAKLVTVAVAVATGWHTYRLARELDLPRPALAVPLLWLQPAFLLLSSETMTEPLFALLLAIALRLHVAGRVRAAMIVASLLPLARPEGFFVGVLWGVLVLLDGRAGRTLVRRALGSLWLALGAFLWWLAAYVMTRDPLFIPHVWPAGWGATSATYGTGPLFHYYDVRHQILAGPVLEALFAAGLVLLALRRRFAVVVAPLVLVVVLHAVFFVYGLFGSAGYARYLVCVAPPMAIVTLAGWNAAARLLSFLPRALGAALGAVVLAAALAHCVIGVDRWGSSRDALAVESVVGWFRQHPRPYRQLVFSQAYMAIALGRDPAGRPALGQDVEQNVRILRATPPGTLAFWDANTGPLFHRVGPHEFLRAGFQHVYSESFYLRPRLPASRLYPLRWLIPAAEWPYPYRQELYLFYKPFP